MPGKLDIYYYISRYISKSNFKVRGILLPNKYSSTNYKLLKNQVTCTNTLYEILSPGGLIQCCSLWFSCTSCCVKKMRNRETPTDTISRYNYRQRGKTELLVTTNNNAGGKWHNYISTEFFHNVNLFQKDE